MAVDRTMDPVAAVREILAGGPVPAPEFRRLAREQGIPVKGIPKAVEAAGARYRRDGRPGEGGWVYELTTSEGEGIIERPGRKGFYAHFFFHGREIQCKLADDLETATVRLAELRRKLEQEWESLTSPRPWTPKLQAPPKPLHEQMQELARQMLRVARLIEEAAPQQPAAS
jgi:hypothetical protein